MSEPLARTGPADTAVIAGGVQISPRILSEVRTADANARRHLHAAAIHIADLRLQLEATRKVIAVMRGEAQ